jgi:hypothetical protein
MDTFKKIGPSKVRHESGYVVSAIDRWTLGIAVGDRCAVVAVDYGAAGAERMYISGNTLSDWKSAQGSTAMSEEEQRAILAKLAAGHQAMVRANVEVIVTDN